MVRLRPGTRPLRRATDEVQIGLSPDHGIVLGGLSEQEAQLLLSLAASSGTGCDDTLAEQFGVSLERVGELIATLDGHGLLLRTTTPPAPHTVALAGHGSVVDRLREVLGSEPEVRVQEAVPEQPDAVDLAILCTRDAVAPHEGRAWHQLGLPHLPVVVRPDEAVIGPLVRPGETACLTCLDLHRRDRDRAWPRILTQLSSPLHELAPPVDETPTRATAVASLVALVAVESLRPGAPSGVSWQIALPLPEVRTRVWEPHPHCPCAATGMLATTPPQQDQLPVSVPDRAGGGDDTPVV